MTDHGQQNVPRRRGGAEDPEPMREDGRPGDRDRATRDAGTSAAGGSGESEEARERRERRDADLIGE